MTNREILEKANQAFSQGDYEEFLTYCTEDTKWTYVGDRTLDGKDEVRQYLSTAHGSRHSGLKSILKEAKIWLLLAG